jgi:hypothetical protein
VPKATTPETEDFLQALGKCAAPSVWMWSERRGAGYQAFIGFKVEGEGGTPTVHHFALDAEAVAVLCGMAQAVAADVWGGEVVDAAHP